MNIDRYKMLLHIGTSKKQTNRSPLAPAPVLNLHSTVLLLLDHKYPPSLYSKTASLKAEMFAQQKLHLLRRCEDLV